ncbi:MFS general substrate transporter [Fistulina hepatica ATCC 64428]|uniref:MFS general substrate transporter n=1 Tax=Fistulina hepatica ATCC 64428 TaxID=1128425 RepID=A0A0D7A7V6_9AGAR|nr:MFS general substrate transporter [Fistulina hepatica ATCC 64428]
MSWGKGKFSRRFLSRGGYTTNVMHPLGGFVKALLPARVVYTIFGSSARDNHPLVRLIIPTLAKLMDVFGRFEILIVSIVFYLIGTIVEASSNGVRAFSGGAILYQIGYTAVQLPAEVIVGDTTTLRNRVLFSFVPAAPFVINAWISGNVTEAVLAQTTWRWGIGMWALIYFVCAMPLCFTLWYGAYKAELSGTLAPYKTPFQQLGFIDLIKQLFWQLDAIGMILVIAVFALILVPFTIAGSTRDEWATGHIIAMLVIAVCCIPVLPLWQTKAKHPLIPFRLLKDRGVWAALGIAMLLNCSWYLQGEYLYTVLVVAFNMSIDAATRLTNVYSFVSVVVGIGLGFVVRYVRYLKPFIVFGVALFMVAFGLLIRYRGGESTSSHAAVIGAQVVLGFGGYCEKLKKPLYSPFFTLPGGGLFAYPTQASIQAGAKHEHLAIITSLYLASYQIGSALGSSISGAIWTNVLPGQLEERLNDATLAAEVYESPLTVGVSYAMDTPERQAIVSAYKYAQRLLCITGICLCIPLLMFSLLLRNPRLTDSQSLPEAEASDTESVASDKKSATGAV